MRLVNQRPAQRGALLHAAGQLPGKFVAETGEADARQQRLDAVAKFGSCAFARTACLNGGTILSGSMTLSRIVQPRQQGRVLERHADPHWLGADLAAGDEHVAVARPSAFPRPA